MTKDVVVGTPEETIGTLARLMVAQNVGSVPVVENSTDRRLVGVLTDRDIVVRVIAAGNDPNATRVEEVMTADPVTCRPADDLDTAAHLMMERQVRRLFVVEDGRLVGVIAQADIASRGGQRNLTAQVVEAISQQKNE